MCREHADLNGRCSFPRRKGRVAKVSVMVRRDVMTPEVKQVLRRRVHSQKALSHVGRLESPHRAFSRPRFLVRAFDSIVRISRRISPRIRYEVTVRDVVAGELIGNDAARFCFGGLEGPSEEPFRCGSVAFLRQISVDNLTVLVDGSPQLVLCTADFNDDFIDEERVTEACMAPAQSLRIVRAKLPAPGANGLVADRNTSFGQQILDVSCAQAEAVMKPHGVLDDLRGESVAFVHRMKRLHASMLAHSTLTCQNPSTCCEGKCARSTVVQTEPSVTRW